MFRVYGLGFRVSTVVFLESELQEANFSSLCLEDLGVDAQNSPYCLIVFPIVSSPPLVPVSVVSGSHGRVQNTYFGP